MTNALDLLTPNFKSITLETPNGTPTDLGFLVLLIKDKFIFN